MNVDDELLEAFLEESDENLNQLDLDLVALEASPQDPELLARIFRTIHTVKGTCGFLGFGRLEGLSHAGEDLLASLRSGDLVLDEDITTSLLSLVDEVRLVLTTVADTGTEGEDDHAEVIADLRRHLEVGRRDDPASQTGSIAPTEPTAASPAPAAFREESTVRIDVSVLDGLQDLVGELTLARMRLGDFVPEHGPLAHSYHRLTTITRDLQDTVMQARLQPIATATGRLRRIVRDVAASQHKQVRLVIEGDDVTVDKAINEILRDPLVHLVRNAVDHGIESPVERIAAGKPAEATVTIRASLIGGGVHLVVSDDGRGIDVQRLIESAVAAGRVAASDAAELTPDQRMALVFAPGVSTAAEVTTVSGRGVGMDVVRSSLQQVGGSIEVWSEPGAGSSFRIDVPLTLAILPALIVHCGPNRCTVPQTDVQAVVRVTAEEVAGRLHAIGSARFLRYRGSLLPLIDLAEYLGIEPSTNRAGQLEIVVIRKFERAYGLIVDEVGDDFDAVVKPLPRAIRAMAQYAGTTLLSDGSPSLILETAAPAASAHLETGLADPDARTAEESQNAGDSLVTLLVGGERFAIALGRVRRLERIDAAAVEHSGRHEVVQYHDTVLPISELGQVLGRRGSATPPGPGGRLSVVVCRGDHPDVGLVVDVIGDIEATPLADVEPTDLPGVVGQFVLGGFVTELLDVDWVVARALRPTEPDSEHRHG
ncbi:MAG: two-component system, chemotaxis family, sensor kinase CheA [Actinomycetota bacterium]|nr:two-component system, chemotaxis family, sensor kinase CheA [Actinomycetota bacterium]